MGTTSLPDGFFGSNLKLYFFPICAKHKDQDKSFFYISQSTNKISINY